MGYRKVFLISGAGSVIYSYRKKQKHCPLSDAELISSPTMAFQRSRPGATSQRAQDTHIRQLQGPRAVSTGRKSGAAHWCPAPPSRRVIIEPIFPKLYYKTIQTINYMNYNFIQKNPYRKKMPWDPSVSVFRTSARSRVTAPTWLAWSPLTPAPLITSLVSFPCSV